MTVQVHLRGDGFAATDEATVAAARPRFIAVPPLYTEARRATAASPGATTGVAREKARRWELWGEHWFVVVVVVVVVVPWVK